MKPISHFLFLLASCTMAAAHAQGLPDPTRPPAALEAAPAAGVAAAAPTGLQTVIHREGAKPAAVINGVYVELGGRVGDARLVAIGDDSVTLQGEAGREVLRLTPGIEKQPAVPAAAKTESKSGSRRAAQREAGDEARKQ
jgi:hypothetical protein